MKRWLTLFTILGAMTCTALFFSQRYQERFRQRERFKQVYVGMPKDAAVALMGDGETVVYVYESNRPPSLCRHAGWRREEWRTRRVFFITLDDDVVVEKEFREN